MPQPQARRFVIGNCAPGGPRTFVSSDDTAATGSTADFDHANAHIDAVPASILVVGVDYRR